MTCQWVNLPGGGRAIVKYSEPARKRCSACGCLTAAKEQRECDWKLGNGKTCDRLICTGCATVPAPDKDLCPEHAAVWKIKKPTLRPPTKGE